MNKQMFLYTITAFIFNCFSTNYLQAESIEQIVRIQDPIKQIEATLLLSPHVGKDTVLLKNELAPLLLHAEHTDNIPLQWAYYMLMADGFSVALDNTNSRSDHFYFLANKLVKKHKQTELEMVGLIRQGYYHFVYRKIIEAFPFFLNANELKATVDIRNILHPVQHYQFSASFFSYISDHQSAIAYLKEAAPFTKNASRERINLLNSIALYHEELNNKEDAISYFNSAIKEAEIAKDSVWIGILSGNLSNYAWEKGNTSEAIRLLKKNVNLSLQYNESQDAMRVNLQLANRYISLHQWQLAQEHVLLGKELMEPKPYYLQYQMDAEYLLSKIAQGMNKKAEQLEHLNHYIILRDSLEARRNVKEMQKIIWQSERDKYNRTLQYAEEKRQEIRRQFLFLGVFGALIFFIILLLINKSRNRIKIQNATLEKEQLALTYEKQLVDQEVGILKNSLEDFTQTIKQNDAIIAQLRHDIRTVPEEYEQQVHSIKEHLNTMLDAHIMTDERWFKFKNVFDKVYPHYLVQIKEEFEKITENDLKLIALQKLGLSNNSMSELLCISIEGIKKAKQRLKKKMEKMTQNEVDSDN